MKSFLSENFLLNNKTGERLFHAVASDLPIIDYHNHLNPTDVATNKTFSNIAQLCINHDPYKHRAMRMNGVPEEYITGRNTSDKEKFLAWAGTVSKTIGNPLFHWNCLELKRIFGIDDILNGINAESIWHECNSKLAEQGSGTLDILHKWKAEVVCTSDGLLDSLQDHILFGQQTQTLSLFPSLRADSILAFDSQNQLSWMNELANLTSIEIASLKDLEAAIIQRLEFFKSAHCCLADISLDAGFSFRETDEQTASGLFYTYLQAGILQRKDVVSLQSYLLVFLGKEFSKRSWTMQLHIGAQRYTSSRLRSIAGPAGGYATIGNATDISALCSYMDVLEKSGYLPKIILYSLNPADYAGFATLTGSFPEDGVPGKVQFGPAWWFNDHQIGIVQHLVTISSYGLLSNFIGMTTDSRSVLSFSRHEYFRRILCNLVGEWVERGELPNDDNLLSTLIKNISYENSKSFIFK